MGIFGFTLKTSFGIVRRLPAVTTAAAVGWIGYSAFKKREYPPLPSPFLSDLQFVPDLEAGRIALHRSSQAADEDTTPVLLVHSVNAAASSAEMGPLFQRLERDRQVASMDLPGFGHSDRPDVAYTPELMAGAIASVLGTYDRPVHVVALSLGSELAARAALIRPDRVRSLTFISPTGMGRKSRVDEAEDSVFDSILTAPVLGQAIFDLLITEPSIRYFLDKSFAGEVDPGLSVFSGLTSRQPGARHAPLAFIRGRLFTADALSRVYEPLLVPSLVIYDEDPYTDFADLPGFTAGGDGTRHAERIPGTRGLPHFDNPEQTLDALNRFWKDVESR
ncbi:MAG: alpha/beta hydrolase [Acidimicrobiia bacterium]